MKDEKKQTILNEILFWKENKLLPVQYCDFLMTLYTEGEEVELPVNQNYKETVKTKEKRKIVFLSLFLFAITFVLLFMLFVPQIYEWMMLILSGVVGIVFIFLGFKGLKKYQLLIPLMHVAAALLILGVSVKVSITFFEGNHILLYILLFLNCFMWTIIGYKAKRIYFTISGILGAVIVIVYPLFFA